MEREVTETFYPANRQEWRHWLEENHQSKKTIWLVCYKKHTNKDTITWSDAVDEALCFGWIDSTARPLDADRFLRSFTRRKPTGTWSKINKAKVTQLIADGLMTPAGLECIEKAKENGSWEMLDEVEERIIPKDLVKAFKTQAGSKAFFLSLSKSVQKAMLQWVALAKRPATRENRIAEIVRCAAKHTRPKQF